MERTPQRTDRHFGAILLVFARTSRGYLGPRLRNRGGGVFGPWPPTDQVPASVDVALWHRGGESKVYIDLGPVLQKPTSGAVADWGKVLGHRLRAGALDDLGVTAVESGTCRPCAQGVHHVAKRWVSQAEHLDDLCATVIGARPVHGVPSLLRLRQWGPQGVQRCLCTDDVGCSWGRGGFADLVDDYGQRGNSQGGEADPRADASRAWTTRPAPWDEHVHRWLVRASFGRQHRRSVTAARAKGNRLTGQ